MIDNEMLKQALDETADRHFSKYDIQPEEKPHRFSLVFKIREKSITKLSKKPEKNTHSYMPLKRLAVMIAVISVIAALGIAAGAGFIIIKGFNVYTQSSHNFGVTHTDTILEVDYSKYDIKTEIALDEYYCLAEDSGCKFVEYGLIDRYMNSADYDRGGRYLYFGQYTAGTGLFMDDISDVVFHEVEVNGNDGVLCTDVSKYKYRMLSTHDLHLTRAERTSVLFPIPPIPVTKTQLLSLSPIHLHRVSSSFSLPMKQAGAVIAVERINGLDLSASLSISARASTTDCIL